MNDTERGKLQYVADRIRPTRTLGWEDEPTGLQALHDLEDLFDSWLEGDIEDKLLARNSYIILEEIKERLQKAHEELVLLIEQKDTEGEGEMEGGEGV